MNKYNNFLFHCFRVLGVGLCTLILFFGCFNNYVFADSFVIQIDGSSVESAFPFENLNVGDIVLNGEVVGNVLLSADTSLKNARFQFTLYPVLFKSGNNIVKGDFSLFFDNESFSLINYFSIPEFANFEYNGSYFCGFSSVQYQPNGDYLDLTGYINTILSDSFNNIFSGGYNYVNLNRANLFKLYDTVEQAEREANYIDICIPFYKKNQANYTAYLVSFATYAVYYEAENPDNDFYSSNYTFFIDFRDKIKITDNNITDYVALISEDDIDLSWVDVYRFIQFSACSSILSGEFNSYYTGNESYFGLANKILMSVELTIDNSFLILDEIKKINSKLDNIENNTALSNKLLQQQIDQEKAWEEELRNSGQISSNWSDNLEIPDITLPDIDEDKIDNAIKDIDNIFTGDVSNVYNYITVIYKIPMFAELSGFALAFTLIGYLLYGKRG